MSVQSIRPARAEDAAAIAVLVERAYSKWIPIVGRSPKPMLADYDAAVAKHLVFVVDARRSAKLAGVIELVPMEGHMLVENVAVDPESQRNGLGGALLEYAETVARERGFGEIRLYTNALMQVNIDLYEWLGYAVIERRRIEELDTTAVYMSKRLG